MLWGLLWQWIVPVALIAGAVIIALYVPFPLKRWALEAVAVAFVLSSVYGHAFNSGRESSDKAWRKQIEAINKKNAEEVARFQKEAADREAANEKMRQAELDALDRDKKALEAAYGDLITQFENLPVDAKGADAPVSPIILKAIKGTDK